MRRTFATVVALGLLLGSLTIAAPATGATPAVEQEVSTPSWTGWVVSSVLEFWASLVEESRENYPTPHQAPPDQADGGPEWDPNG